MALANYLRKIVGGQAGGPQFNLDAFYDGQISSKLWLCEVFESVVLEALKETPLKIRVYGSWQGMLPFMLLVRDKVQVSDFFLYDVDQAVHPVARRVLDHWHFKGRPKIHHMHQDCNEVMWSGVERGDVVINTSCEHMGRGEWWQRIPSGVLYCLQTTDMPHPEHVSPARSMEHWLSELGLRAEDCLYVGQRRTEYESFAFTRWMVMGVK